MITKWVAVVNPVEKIFGLSRYDELGDEEEEEEEAGC
jgi:hypothetical protein